MFFKRQKKAIISSIIGLILGYGVIGSSYVPAEEYNTALSQKADLSVEISSIDEKINEESVKLEVLEEQKLAKEEQERIAREEAERLAKEAEERRLKEEAEKAAREEAERVAKAEAERMAKESASASTSNSNGSVTQGQMVWLSATGEKYHSRNNCGRMNPSKAMTIDVQSAISQGFGACSKCF